MLNYIARRLLLLPLTLFCIIFVNFVIINLAPGDPVTITEISKQGTASRKEDSSFAFGSDERYLQFREHYGLTLPIVINLWPYLSLKDVLDSIETLVKGRGKLGVKQYEQLRLRTGDQSRYVMPHLLQIIEDKKLSLEIRQMAIRFFVRGGTRQGYVGYELSDAQKAYNRKAANDNEFLRSVLKNNQSIDKTVRELKEWYQKNEKAYHFNPKGWEKFQLIGQTRFFRYFSRVITLDFGTLRNDHSKSVIGEVVKRFKYSLTLSFLPMIATFFLSQLFGFIMASYQNQWQDLSFNVIFLILYAIPIFVVAPFLIEKVALNHHFPFTDISIPISGFTSSESKYVKMTSYQRLWDVLQHIALPLAAVMYGSLAASSRLSRTAVLEVMRQDYVRTARAKGVGKFTLLGKHIGRNAAITILTSIAGSLGVVLGGSLIVEILFEINGFGKFFYDAVVNRDYNVIMFSALAGSFLTLMGYLTADICYTLLDPRVTFE